MDPYMNKDWYFLIIEYLTSLHKLHLFLWFMDEDIIVPKIELKYIIQHVI